MRQLIPHENDHVGRKLFMHRDTAQTEQLDPQRLQDLAAMRRWLAARTRSIRLADLLIEVENDLAFSAHFHHPGERRMDAEETCALLATIIAHGCNQ